MSPAELTVLHDPEASYSCPGEARPITRSLHLARLAAGHHGCQNCRHNQETERLPKHIASRAAARIAKRSPPLISEAGIRGQYINQLTRERMGEIVEHLLELVDFARYSDEEGAVHGGLRIVTGYDSRPASPDLAIGVVAVLKRWGCEVADLGLVTRPAFDVAMDRYRPHAGLYLTGGNHPVAFNGLDVLDAEGMPWCFPGKLQQLEAALERPISRLSRSLGRYESIDFQDEYLANLSQTFHAIRPLRIAVACPDPLVRRHLKSQLDETSCSVQYLAGNTLTLDQSERSVKSLVDLLCERRFDVGFAMGMDGRTCRVYDEGGHELTLSELLDLLSHVIPQGREAEPPQNGWIQQRPLRAAGDLQAEEAASSAQVAQNFVDGSLHDLLREHQLRKSPMAADSEFRIWFRDELPQCDAIQTVAKVLEVLSISDRPVSAFRRPRKTLRPSRL